MRRRCEVDPNVAWEPEAPARATRRGLLRGALASASGCLALLAFAAAPATAQKADINMKKMALVADFPIDNRPPNWEVDEKAAGLPRWPFVADLVLPKDVPLGTRFGVVELPGPVLGKAQLDLADLRLTDSQGNRLPYARRVLRDSLSQLAVRIERRYDSGPVVKERAFEEKFELAPVPLAGHNDIEIQTPGDDFRRPVQVYGSNTPDFANAQSLLPAKTFLVRFTVQGKLIEVNRFRYAPKEFRFLKVRVDADPHRADDAPTIAGIIVRHTEKTVGKYLTYPVQMGPTQGVRGQGGPGTAYDFILGEEPTICEKLTLKLDRAEIVDRPFRLQAANPGQVRIDIGPVDWRWRKEDGHQIAELSFAEAETRVQTLRLVITDFLNEPLRFTEAKGTMAARQIYFEWPDAAKTPLPLKLYFGYPGASAPNYDLEKRLPEKIDPAPATVQVGARQLNPSYVPPEPDFSERHPWAIYGVLAFASLVLAGLLVPLGKQAIASAKQRDSVGERA
jgi:hypothetical protein